MTIGVEPDTQRRQPRADLGADRGVVLADAAGEDDPVDTVQHRPHRGQLLTHGVAEHPDRQRRIRVRWGGCTQCPHVAVESGEARQTAAVVHKVFQHCGSAAASCCTIDSHERP